MKETTREIERSSFIQVYMGLNTSLSVTAKQSLPSRFLATLVSFLLSPATKINKMGANGVMGSRKSRGHSFYHLGCVQPKNPDGGWYLKVGGGGQIT